MYLYTQEAGSDSRFGNTRLGFRNGKVNSKFSYTNKIITISQLKLTASHTIFKSLS